MLQSSHGGSVHGDQALLTRIDDQSQLITILKKRADEACQRVQCLESLVKELRIEKQQLETRMRDEVAKVGMLEKRFHQLASNHEELITIKDEYKASNEEIRKENVQLLEENTKLFSTAVMERDGQLLALRGEFQSLETKYNEICKSNSELHSQLTATDCNSQHQIGDLSSKLKKAQEDIENAVSQLDLRSESHRECQDSLKKNIADLTHEKEELLDLAVHRGKLLQEKQDDIKELKTKFATSEKKTEALALKFEGSFKGYPGTEIEARLGTNTEGF
ncbi:PREDICTED: coiled-coil domain-containing protein 89-like isoform X2 [Priapulus caudatus]|uniref:Coiled-coil domain-containing protein 89-like isoform X2 n=1 Tax=Priapulus caudatus TaxID=37621 RepID=A0ABM1EL99_PRICU|nr:PREDICTED: coiled-coil domain-containing protein 89-like isoform X2 [Priapulus caudatus]